MPIGREIVMRCYNVILHTGGGDKLVKLWGYDNGDMTHVGIGHSGCITSVKICSNNKYIISTSSDGGVLRWRYPQPAH